MSIPARSTGPSAPRTHPGAQIGRAPPSSSPAIPPAAVGVEDDPPGEASSALEILRGQGVSAHLVQVRTRVRPHFHRDQEETAYIAEGSGIFVVGKRAYPMKAGSLMIVPKGAVHSYEAREPTVALAISTPTIGSSSRNRRHPLSLNNPG